MQSILFETFIMIFLAEMGDKSQLLMVAMTAEYKMRDILLGTAVSVMALNLLAVLAGYWIGDLLPHTAISLIAGVAFLLFAYLSFGENEENHREQRRRRASALAVFGTYFLAELGDKTQISVLTLTADGKGSVAYTFAVFLGATLALYAADLLGLWVGHVMKKRLPQQTFGAISAVLFLACGATRLLDGFSELFHDYTASVGWAIACTMIPTAIVTVICIYKFIGQKRQKCRIV